MKKILIISALCLLFAGGCLFKEKIYQTHEFLAAKDKVDGKQLLLKGFVRYKFPCDQCDNGYIFLTNDMDRPMSEQTVLAINVAKDKLTGYEQLKVGDEIILRAEYHTGKTEAPIVSNELGYFQLIYFITDN